MTEKEANSLTQETVKNKDSQKICRVCEPPEEKRGFRYWREILTLVPGTAVYLTVLFLHLPAKIEFFLFLLSYVIIGGDIIFRALKDTFRGKFFDENFLMTVATVGAFAIRYFPEAVAVMLFYKVGELFENISVNRSRRSIRKLLSIRPDYANLKKGKKTEKVDPTEVKPGDTIIIKPGEKVPLDGMIKKGKSFIDTSNITGEPEPDKMVKGDEILSGMVNRTGLLHVTVTREYEKSTVAKILNLVENASEKKAPTEKFITKFAKIYTPTVVGIAILLAFIPSLMYKVPIFQPIFKTPPLLNDWIYRALIFLVISCPCALVISIPLSFFAGIGSSSKNGILIKGSSYLEGLNNLGTIVWDKTGTLTHGDFRVAEVVRKDNYSRDEMLRFAASAEKHSSHPLAHSIKEAYRGPLEEVEVENYREIPGNGIEATIEGEEILVGNDQLLHRKDIPHDRCDFEETVVHLAIGGEYAGYFIFSDEIREDARKTIEELKSRGIKNHLMLTGDIESVARSISEKLGLKNYYAELLPHEKVERIEKLLSEEKEGKLVAFVGDGVNDAPVIMRSDIGIAMGALGSDAAIESADIVLMADEPSKLIKAHSIAGKTRRIVLQNISMALFIKFIFLTLGGMGKATMWEAVFADVGVALLAILNATRAFRT